MNSSLHPSCFLAPELCDALRVAAAEAERQGALLPAQLDIIYRQRWFNLFVPPGFGGLGLSLTEALRLQEGLAWADGSTGWTVTLCSGAAWFIGFLEPAAAHMIFSNGKACLAGSGQPSGIANVVEDGYQVTGHWNWATGAPHATVFTANCVLYKDGVLQTGPDGQPLVKAFWFHRQEVTVRHNWYTIGMVATASHSFEVEGLTLPPSRCFVIDPANVHLEDVIFQYPFRPFAGATLAVNSAGMAVRFMDLSPSSTALEHAKGRLSEERTAFYKTVDDSWSGLLRDGSLSTDTVAAVGRASRRLASLSLKLVDELYPHCGLRAVDRRTEINRVWRNLHTASQHSLLRES